MSEESTKIDENILEKNHFRAMELKFQGVIYAKIAEELGVSESTIKSWFQEGGLLFEKYYEYAERKLTEMEKESRILLRREIWNAVAVLNQALKEVIKVKTKCPKCQEEHFVSVTIPTNNRIKASVEVLDRVFGKSVQPMQLSGGIEIDPYDDLSDDELDKRIKEIEETKAQEERA